MLAPPVGIDAPEDGLEAPLEPLLLAELGAELLDGDPWEPEELDELDELLDDEELLLEDEDEDEDDEELLDDELLLDEDGEGIDGVCGVVGVLALGQPVSTAHSPTAPSAMSAPRGLTAANPIPVLRASRAPQPLPL